MSLQRKGGVKIENQNSNVIDSQERYLMEEWCYISGGYSREYYEKLPDDKLIQLYEEMVQKK